MVLRCVWCSRSAFLSCSSRIERFDSTVASWSTTPITCPSWSRHAASAASPSSAVPACPAAAAAAAAASAWASAASAASKPPDLDRD